MKETETTFTLTEEDDCNIIEIGTWEKVKADKCPKCGSACLLGFSIGMEAYGHCAKCGFSGRRRRFILPYRKENKNRGVVAAIPPLAKASGGVSLPHDFIKKIKELQEALADDEAVIEASDEVEKELREKIEKIKEAVEIWVNQMDKVGTWRAKRGMQHYDYMQYEGQKLKELKNWIKRQ